ncbi:MAG: heparinase II/III domain-containing protein, partial [Candidatus Latescibacterota bacterium]
RVSSYTSNWIGDVTGGGVLCALAIMNDIPEEELEPYLSGMILKMDRLIENAFDRDGHYGEGYSYLNHALECINEAGPALERTFGIEFPEKLFRSWRFLLYQTNTGTRAVYDYGDSSERLGGLSNFTWLLEKSRSPYLKWLYDIAPGSRDVDLFHVDESMPSQSPGDLQKSVHFRDSGTVIFRSGFAPEDFTFVFRCGPFYNHQHFDQGTFFLADRKEDFLVEGGKTDYYGDPWYQKLFIQPLGHNCILLDGDPESQRAGDLLKDVPAWRDHASISDFLSFEGGAFVSGRLDPLYKGKIEHLRRSALYLAPRTVVLIDEASGPQGVRTMDLLFHAPRRDDISTAGNTATITRPNGKLFIRTLQSASCRAEVKKRPPSLSEFGGENAITMKARGYLQLTADLGNNPVTVINVLSTDESMVSSLREESGSGSSAFSHGGMQYVVNASGGKRFSRGDVETDALVHAIRQDGFIALRASALAQKGRALFSTNQPVNLQFLGGATPKLLYAAPEGANLTLHLGARPKQVLLDGQQIRNWKYDAKSGLRLRLGPGEGTLEIR